MENGHARERFVYKFAISKLIDVAHTILVVSGNKFTLQIHFMSKYKSETPARWMTDTTKHIIT